MPEIDLAGRRVWYRQGNESFDPERTTAVFVHGAGGSSLTWIYQLRALRRGFNCIAPDLPGHGKSDDDPTCEGVGHYVDFMFAFLDALAIEHVVVVGHSMGGAVALDMARAAPERVTGLAIIGAGPIIPVSPLILEALRGTGTMWSRFIEDLVFSPSTPRRFVDKSTAGGLQATREVTARDFVACSRWDRRGDLPTVRSLVIAGRDDAMTPAPLVEALAAGIQGARFELVEDAGHMAMIEQHKSVNELLHDFVGGEEKQTTGPGPGL